MVANQYSKLEQRSVINFLLAEKCKPCEIYRRICNVYGETCFSEKSVHKSARHEFATKSLSQKDSPLSRDTLFKGGGASGHRSQ